MRGSLVHRGKKRWAVVLDLGHVEDPATGIKKRKQKWISVRGDRATAEKMLTKMVGAEHDGTFVDPSKVTVIEYLREWHKLHVAPRRRPNTSRVYLTMIEHVAQLTTIASMPLQKVRTSHLEAFYAAVTLAPSSVKLLHSVIVGAMKKAVRDRLLVVNPATGAERPTKHTVSEKAPCWSASEARTFLTTAKEAGPQASAFFSLAVDAGPRKQELLGLQWADVDLAAGVVTIKHQLDGMAKTGPTFGPTKTKKTRTIEIGAETVARLRLHRKTQAELKLKNRTTYHDYGLVFGCEPADLQTPTMHLGDPAKALVRRLFPRLVKKADVRWIKFHGLRHTCATLLLQGGEPVTNVSARLGHTSVTTTMDEYSHVLPNAQRGAAVRLDSILANG